jgi:small subunit ribosomal protein S13
MVRILGSNLEKDKKIYIALTVIYGIGLARALKILKILSINPQKKIKDLEETESILLRNYLEGNIFQLEGNLKKIINQNIKHLIEINSYRGRRHLKNLPVRGQRTRTNNRTIRKIKNNFQKKK